MSENVRSNRINLWLIGALCAAPVIASYLAFYLARPQAHTNYGELMQTRPLPEARLQLADGAPFQLSRLKGKWILLMVDAGGCDEFCRRKLFTLRQLRLTQGKDMERIERAWLLSDDVTPSADVVSAYAGTWIVRAAGSELLRQLPAARSLSDHIYVIDPLGNLVLRYARDADPAGIIKDLARLLKISRIG
jgi:cytochrome oxidase Cu insertion factor (SCO1/SenC/PrrC family)